MASLPNTLKIHGLGWLILLLVGLVACHVPEKDYPLTPKPVYPTCTLTGYHIIDSAGKHIGANITYDSLGRVTGFNAIDSTGKPSLVSRFAISYINSNMATQSGGGAYPDSVVYNYSGKQIGSIIRYLSDGNVQNIYFNYDSKGRLTLKVSVLGTTIDSIFQTFTDRYRPTEKKVYTNQFGKPKTLVAYFKYEYDNNMNLLNEKIKIDTAFHTHREYTYDNTKPAISKIFFVNSEDPNPESKDRNIHLIQSVVRYETNECGVISATPQLGTSEAYKFSNFNISGFPDSVFVTVSNPCDLSEVVVKGKLSYLCK
jgi:hypothetical protein